MKTITIVRNNQKLILSQPNVTEIRKLMKDSGFKVNVKRLSGSMGHTVMIWAKPEKISRIGAEHICEVLNTAWNGNLYDFDGKEFQVLHAFNGYALSLCVAQKVN